MIRVSHVTLPAGLSALARRGADGELSVYVSDSLDPDRQRAAVRAALRATRREGWRTFLPVPSAVLLAPGVSWLRRAARALRTHPVGWGAASAVVAATSAVVFVTVLPHSHSPVSAGRPPAPAVSQPPAPARSAASSPAPSGAHPRTSHRARAEPVASAPPAAPPGTAVSPATVTVQPAPAPSTPSSAPAPSPSPTPAPSTSPRGSHCIKLLGIRVCLGPGL